MKTHASGKKKRSQFAKHPSGRWRAFFAQTLAALLFAHAIGNLCAQAAEIAAWDFVDFDPETVTSLESGVGTFDWSNIGTVNTTNPGGNLIEFTNVANPGLYFDIALDLTGKDLPILYYDAMRSSTGLSGAWSYSTDGGTNFNSLGYSPSLAAGSLLKPGTVIFENASLRGQNDVVLRYTFSGSVAANGATAGFDQMAIRAVDDTNIVAFVAGGVLSQRALVGLAPEKGPRVDFAISERTGAQSGYSLTGENITIPEPFVSGTLQANQRKPVGTLFSAPLEAITGDTVAATLTVTNHANAEETSSAVLNFQMVENRGMTSGTSGNFGDIGRVVAGHVFGQLEISGGEAEDTHATRITQRAGQFTVGGVDGNVVLSSAGTVYNGANQTSLADIIFPTWSGYGVRSVTLEGFNARSFTDYGWGTVLGSTTQFVGEGLAGESLDLTGMTLNVQATVLQNRSITGGIVDLGRTMVGTGTVTVSGSATATLSGGSQVDSMATRVGLTAGTTNGNGVDVTTLATNFNGANITSNASVDYNFDVDTSITGATIKSVNLASSLTDGELASTGATLQDTLSVGAKYAVVDNRAVIANDVYVAVMTGYDFNNVSIENYITTPWTQDDDHFTRLTVNGVLFDGGYSYTYHTGYQGNLGSEAATSSYSTLVSNASVSVVGEGLLGESVPTVNYDIFVKYVDPSDVTITPSAGTLGHEDVVTISNAAAGSGDRANAAVWGSVFGDSNRFTILDADDNSLGYYDYYTGNYFFSEFLAAGESGQLKVNFNSLGALNGTHSANLTLSVYDSYNDGQSSYFLTYGMSESYNYLLTETVTGQSGQTGSAVVASGSSLKDAGIGLEYTASFTNNASFLDSELLNQNTSIQIAFIDAATAPTANLASDIVDLEGLDGIKFVLQLQYNEDAMIALFGAEEYAQINWFNEDYSLWMNSIYGNSDGGANEQVFFMSYDDYLALGNIDGVPQLSHYGVDVANNNVWAVLDHNSEFGSSGPTSAVPEPTTSLLLVAGIGLLALRRTRFRNRLT